MAEILLSAFLQVLFDRLASPEFLQFAHQHGVLRKPLDRWDKMLTIIRKVLDDAEEKQHSERAVKVWLDDVRDLTYDVEDILDEVATEAALQRTLMGESQASTSQVLRNLIPYSFTTLTPSAVKIKIGLGKRKRKITARMNDLVTKIDSLNLKEIDSPRLNKRRESLLSTFFVSEDQIYGMEEVKEAVLHLLINDKHGDVLSKTKVIPIVGMGGIGKTTLAQLIYNDKKVQSFFDMQAWARVSDDFDVATVTKTFLQSVTSENYDGKDLHWLQVKLKDKLFGKRFLVVLDDVWNENYDDWINLRAPFEAGAPGSSIIVTTRNQSVASLMGTIKVPLFRLELLQPEACLSIFSQHALDAKDFSAHPDLKDIGEEIVRRCKGLPLAIKTVGGLLRGTQDCNEWEKVLKTKIWDIGEERSGIVPALMLSYHNLPLHLKRCFAYCSILPKDYAFKEKELVLLWMAEGLIDRRQDEEKEMEDLGSEYFHNLLSRSFFQQSRFCKSEFFMHDLIHDLAQSVARDICFRMEDRAGGSWHGNLLIKARHSSYLGSQFDVTKRFEVFSKLTSLHTFLPLMLPNSGNCYLAHHVHLKLVPTLRCLRVLSFNGYRITKISDSIGDLKHLRYLDLSNTHIRGLPKSIATLYNLQTLLLEKCTRLKKLPSSMFQKLVNLRHLNIEGAYRLEGMPVQIGKLTCLQTLSNLVVGKDNCSGIKELGPLKYLKGTLHISRLENVIEARDAKDAELFRKPKVSALLFEWSTKNDYSKDSKSELEVLNGLRPHDALKELVIRYYGGTKFPIWLTLPSFPHMVSLTIENCEKCTALPPFRRLPSLKILLIEGMAGVKNVGPEFCGDSWSQSFRSLETLSFKNMKEWEFWSPCEEFPNLHQLSLIGCPKLSGKLPNSLPLLKKVEINDCGQLVVSVSSFPDRCKIVIDEFSEGVVCGSKLAYRSIRFDSFQTISELACRIEGFDHVEGLAKLEDLSIERCEEVTHLWSDHVGLLPRLPFLGVLNIKNCDKLVSLVAEDQVEEPLQLCMPSLRKLTIDNCKALKSLPKAMMCNYMTHLESIRITGCDSLTHFARSQLPPTLKRLYICDCKKIRKLVEDDDTNYSCSSTPSLLESLSILNCPSIEYLTSSGVLPASLRDLNISKCPKMESGAKSFHHNLYLESIAISDCENLKFFNGVDLLPPNLRVLEISSCEKLQALPNGINNLTSLRSLKIRNCQGIQSFPVEGFPTNLTTLAITNLKITDALLDWGLDNLTFLKELHIGGCQHVVYFP